jgi:hypothetical protein
MFQSMCDGQSPDEVRSSADVARRSLALFSVVDLALGADRTDILQWLKDNGLWSTLAPSEVGFIDTPSPSQKQTINAGWLSERLVVLLWALGDIERLPLSNQQCDTRVFQDILPPFARVSVQEFVSRSGLRPKPELIAMADEILALHWEARDAERNGRTPRKPVDLEIVQERHHAINWVIGYDGLPWDEVTTDT